MDEGRFALYVPTTPENRDVFGMLGKVPPSGSYHTPDGMLIARQYVLPKARWRKLWR